MSQDPESIRRRFLSFVEPSEAGGHWLWSGSEMFGAWQKMFRPPRAAVALFGNPDALEGRRVYRTRQCRLDLPDEVCVNPLHLLVGDMADSLAEARIAHFLSKLRQGRLEGRRA